MDPEVERRIQLSGEKRCPYTIRKKARNEKGIKTLAPYIVLKVVPVSNFKMLNKRNQKRWLAIHKENETK